MKKNIIVIVFLLFLIGCSSKVTQTSNFENGQEQYTYEQFENYFLYFKEEFSSSNFVNISPVDLIVQTTSFPANKLVSNKIDALNDNVKYPMRYENYYKSNISNLLVKVNFIFQPDNHTKSFVTINTINHLDNTNIISEYKSTQRPLLDEYIITWNGMLIIINFIDSSSIPEDNYQEKYDDFIEETVMFYKDFENVLLKEQ